MSLKPDALKLNLQMSTDKKMTYNKENPYFSQVLLNYKLNKEASQKDTRHIAFDLGLSGITYKPGDSLYICCKNDLSLVNELLSLLAKHGQLDKSRDLEVDRFSHNVNITRPSNKLFKLVEQKIHELNSSEHLAKDLAVKYNGYSTVAVLFDLFQSFPALKFSTNEIVENSSMLLPRAYSIASSQSVHPNTVELCISRVEEEINREKVLGVCSNYICNRVEIESEAVGIYIHTNDKFRLPVDSSKNIIMVGPGTGIAPFRSFIEERQYLAAQGNHVGRNWLFFGDQRKVFDFLYGNELTKYEQECGLKLDLAFSRDQEHKIYVQHKMKENSDEIFQWLKNGAYFYVCGDARRMAKDVDNALREIAAEHGEDPDAFIQMLKEEGRYCRDVY